MHQTASEQPLALNSTWSARESAVAHCAKKMITGGLTTIEHDELHASRELSQNRLGLQRRV